jgi:hypothetical protein
MNNSSSFAALLVGALMVGMPATSALAQVRPLPSPPEAAPEIPIPAPPNQPYPTTFRPSFQWNYICTRSKGAGCAISCPPNSAISSVAAAQVWLGVSELGNTTAPAIYYYVVYYNGAENVVGTGFLQSTRNLACQVLALKITYSGPPK